MRLNEEGCKGRDFFLLPPDIHGNIDGYFNDTSIPQLEPYRVGNAHELVAAFAQMSVSGGSSSGSFELHVEPGLGDVRMQRCQ